MVEVGADIAPLSCHPGAFDGVGDFPDLFIPLVADLIQEVHKLGISGKGFFQLGFVSLSREKANVILVLGALWSFSSDHHSCGP